MLDAISEGHQVDLIEILYVLAYLCQVQEIPFQNLIESSMSITKFAEKKDSLTFSLFSAILILVCYKQNYESSPTVENQGKWAPSNSVFVDVFAHVKMFFRRLNLGHLQLPLLF